jgi:hypothetical protein
MPIQNRESKNDPPPPLTPREIAAFADHDMREVLWCYWEGIRTALGYTAGSAMATVARALQSCGEDTTDLEDAIAVAVVNGRMVHGLPPRNDAEWAIADRIYEPSTVEELRGWEAADQPAGQLP